MAEWKRVKLGELITDIAAGPFGSNLKISCFVADGFPIIDGANLKGFKVTDNISKFVTEEKARSLSRSIAKRHDVVVTISGTLGQISYIPKGSRYKEYLCSQRQFRATFDEGVVDIPYLVYYFHSREGQQKILVYANQVGVPALYQPLKNFREIEIPLPPLATQKKIAAVLGAIDDKIETNRKICANLEAQAQAIFKSWFVDFEPFGGKMPKDWKEIKLSEIADFYGGYSYKGEELQASNCAMATIKNFERGGGFKLDGFKEIIPSPKLKPFHEVDIFDVLVAHTDLTQKAEVIGNAEMLMSKAGYDKIIMSMDLVKVLPKKGVSKFLLGALLKNPVFKAHCLRYVNGTTVLHMSKSALDEYSLWFPDNSIALNRVSELLESNCKKISAIIDESRALASMRDALLPRLMSGEVDVEKVEVA